MQIFLITHVASKYKAKFYYINFKRIRAFYEIKVDLSGTSTGRALFSKNNGTQKVNNKVHLQTFNWDQIWNQNTSQMIETSNTWKQ